jgi:hypothetical protein
MKTRFEPTMTTHVWKKAFAILVVMLSVAVQIPWATEKSAPGGTQAGKDPGHEQSSLSRYGQELLSGLVGDIQLPKATIESFCGLFQHHQPELERLANTHQELIWGALDVVIEALPSLKTMDAQEGKVRVPRSTYAKASNLLEQCELLASPKLARDLRRAKALFDSMVKESDQESLIIDLKK